MVVWRVYATVEMMVATSVGETVEQRAKKKVARKAALMAVY